MQLGESLRALEQADNKMGCAAAAGRWGLPLLGPPAAGPPPAAMAAARWLLRLLSAGCPSERDRVQHLRSLPVVLSPACPAPPAFARRQLSEQLSSSESRMDRLRREVWHLRATVSGRAGWRPWRRRRPAAALAALQPAARALRWQQGGPAALAAPGPAAPG
jgi:hypothetical protein